MTRSEPAQRREEASPAENSARERVERFRRCFSAIEDEVGKVIVGHRGVVRKVLAAFFAGGHVLLEGVPGLGKTLIVRSVSGALGLSFKRIQFTPDLMPSDIIGAQILTENAAGREFHFRPGPIFAHIVLADEINRASPKTQSAVLEAMQERQVTAFGETYPLLEPFFVLATQNPIELEGTYPLPEAQLDRFFFKLLVEPPGPVDLKEILARTTTERHPVTGPVFPSETAHATIAEMRQLVRQVLIAPPLEDYVVALIAATTPHTSTAIPAVNNYVRFGPGPRAAQALVLGAKVSALLDGRAHASFEDVVDGVLPALRHRLILSFQAEAENVDADTLLTEVLRGLPRP
jgi:MoxR-like ATPase